MNASTLAQKLWAMGLKPRAVFAPESQGVPWVGIYVDAHMILDPLRLPTGWTVVTEDGGAYYYWPHKEWAKEFGKQEFFNSGKDAAKGE